MTWNSRSPVDPIERVNRGGARPRDFVKDHAFFSFVSDLTELEEEIAKTVHGRAVALYESFIVGSYETGSEVDDSSG